MLMGIAHLVIVPTVSQCVIIIIIIIIIIIFIAKCDKKIKNELQTNNSDSELTKKI